MAWFGFALLLMVGSTFFIADGIQTVTAGALRGLNDTRSPLLFAAIQRAYINKESSSSASAVPIVKSAGGSWRRSAYSAETSGSRRSTSAGTYAAANFSKSIVRSTSR